MVWTQEEEHKHLKSPYTKYSVGLTYTVWIDVEAKDQDEALDLACNSNYSIDVKAKDNHKRVNVVEIAELNEYEDPKVWCEND